MKTGFTAYIRKDFALSRRNMLIWLIVLFPIITAFGASGITETYSDTPKIVVLEEEKNEFRIPDQVQVLISATQKDLIQEVNDIDAKIGFVEGKLVTDGREPAEAVEKAKRILEEKPIESDRLSSSLFEKVYAFNLYGSFLFFGIIILFSLVEERKNKTTELQNVQPVHPAVPILSKITIATFITLFDFVICSYLLKLPFVWETAGLIILIGILLGTVLGMAMAFYASTETQALAILKPVTLVFLMAIPGLGFFLEGEIMHNIAMADPFYWLLQLVYGLYMNDLNYTYVYLSLGLSAAALCMIAANWHRTPYGIKKAKTY